MAAVIAIVVVAVLAAGVAAVLLTRRRRPAAKPAGHGRTPIPPAAPMIGLESALDQVTDRDGRRLRERIEDATAIDELRVPDDSGPILRRALDHVEHTHDHTHVDHGHVDAGDLPPATDTSAEPGTPPPDQTPA